MTKKRSSVHHRFFSKFATLRNILALLPLVLLAGCGDVEWLPEYERDPTAPDSFQFESKKGVEPEKPVTSEPVTVSGILAGSAPISISGTDGSNSKYSIDGKTATDGSGTVSNGAKVTVTHTAAKGIGDKTTSTLTIGKVSGTFSSTTRTVSLAWQEPTDVGSYRQAIAVVTADDSASGGHVISVKDSSGSSNPRFAVTDSNSSPTFRKEEGTFFRLDDQRIYVQNLRSSTATTTLTIDGADFAVPLTK